MQSLSMSKEKIMTELLRFGDFQQYKQSVFYSITKHLNLSNNASSNDNSQLRTTQVFQQCLIAGLSKLLFSISFLLIFKGLSYKYLLISIDDITQ